MIVSIQVLLHLVHLILSLVYNLISFKSTVYCILIRSHKYLYDHKNQKLPLMSTTITREEFLNKLNMMIRFSNILKIDFLLVFLDWLVQDTVSPSVYPLQIYTAICLVSCSFWFSSSSSWLVLFSCIWLWCCWSELLQQSFSLQNRLKKMRSNSCRKVVDMKQYKKKFMDELTVSRRLETAPTNRIHKGSPPQPWS